MRFLYNSIRICYSPVRYFKLKIIVYLVSLDLPKFIYNLNCTPAYYHIVSFFITYEIMHT